MKSSSSGFAMPGFIKFIKHAVKHDKQKSPPMPKQNGKITTVEVPAQTCAEPRIQIYERSNFLIGSSIGQGSFALVYKGKERATGREVAMKVVRAQDQIEFDEGGAGCPDDAYRDVLDAMRIEANIIAGIGAHPSIVQLLGVTADFTVLVMERGLIDIYCLLKKQPLVSLSMARRWMKHLLTAIDYLHELRIVHQDIKSSNVIIFPDHTAKLCDFGLARDVEGEMPVDRELVTLWYRPPELLMGATKYTERVDEWGAGCVALELVTGGSPFRGKPGNECTCPEPSHYNYNSDQLTKIFSVLGTPPPSCPSWSLACAGHFAPWPRHARILEARVGEACRRRQELAEEEEAAQRRRPTTSHREPASAPVSPSRGSHASLSSDEEDGEAAERRAERWADEEAQWVEMVASLLTFQPGRRMTARAALDLPLFSQLRPGRRLAISMAEGRSLLPEVPPLTRTASSPAGSGAGAARHFASSGGSRAAAVRPAGALTGSSSAAAAAFEMRALDSLLEVCRSHAASVATPRTLASPTVAPITATASSGVVRREASSTASTTASLRPVLPKSGAATAAVVVSASTGRLSRSLSAKGEKKSAALPPVDLPGMLPVLPAGKASAGPTAAGRAAEVAEAPDVFFL